jgi:hypothetical protein
LVQQINKNLTAEDPAAFIKRIDWLEAAGTTQKYPWQTKNLLRAIV